MLLTLGQIAIVVAMFGLALGGLLLLIIVTAAMGWMIRQATPL